jgi:hypothetical protein
MSADTGQPVPEPAPIDIWQLPEIVKLEARLARYRNPKRYTTREGPQEIHQAVEVDLYTDGEFVQRALSPVLRVGDVTLVWGDHVGKNHYRFRAVQPEMDLLREGNPVELVWPVERGAADRKASRAAPRLPPIIGRRVNNRRRR